MVETTKAGETMMPPSDGPRPRRRRAHVRLRVVELELELEGDGEAIASAFERFADAVAGAEPSGPPANATRSADDDGE